jgi:hypothetical protein
MSKENYIERHILSSSQSKPTNVPIGTTALEYDTGDMYINYDKTNYVPKVERVGYKLKQISVTKALAASAAYQALDVMSETASAPSATAWNFQGVGRANGGGGEIIKAMVIDQTGTASALTTLLLFNVNPSAAALADHLPNTAPLHADQNNYIGRIDFPSMSRLSSGDATAIVAQGTSPLPLPFICNASDDDLYGIMITREVFTQTATTDLIVKLLVRQY